MTMVRSKFLASQSEVNGGFLGLEGFIWSGFEGMVKENSFGGWAGF